MTEFDREMIERLNEAMIAAVPFNAALGLKVTEGSARSVTLRLEYREELVGNPDTGVLHGGVITGLIDATCGLAIFLRMWPNLTRIATLDLRIDYLKPAAPRQAVLARAECYKLTRQIAFVRAIAFHQTPEDPIASAAGSFMIFDDSRSPVARAIEAVEGKKR